MSSTPLNSQDYFIEEEIFISEMDCLQIVTRFEKFKHLASSNTNQPSRSQGHFEELDLDKEEWGDWLDILEPKIKKLINVYLERFLTNNSDYYYFSHATFRKYNRDCFETIHYDSEYAVNHGSDKPIRNFLCLLYLNEDFEGGEHVFPLQSKVFKPSQGKMVIYPTSLMFPNMGLPCYEGDKLLIRFNYHLDTELKSNVECYKK